MEIEFEITDDRGRKIRVKEITIIGKEELRPGQTVEWMKEGPEKEFKEHKIGHIFTPGGSGHTVKNAVQICGFEDAFDLWGCAVFAGPTWKGLNKQYTRGRRYRGQDGHYHYEQKELLAQKKDIQLQFSMETIEHHSGAHNVCLKCYNNPCTCEIQIKHDNPYTVKRSQDLWLEQDEKNKSIRVE